MSSIAPVKPAMLVEAPVKVSLSPQDWQQMRSGEVLIQTAPHSNRGGKVTARICIPRSVRQVWSQVSDYPRWVEFFPDITRSEVRSSSPLLKRVYQVACKSFLFLSARVEILLQVQEVPAQRIHFTLERGDFSDFAAELTLAEHEAGTLLSYTVAATPAIPVPALLIQQGMTLELPTNLRTMRQVICRTC